MSPKLSDALRAMADRAPVGEASVSAHAAIRSIKTRRAVRVTANSLMGAGAAAAIAFAVIVPTLSAGPGGEPAPAALPELAGGHADGSAGYDAADTRLAYGLCGGPMGTQEEGVPGSLSIAGLPTGSVEGGSEISPELTLAVTDAVSGSLSAPGVLVLWDGIVVGNAVTTVTEPVTLDLAAGDSHTTTVSLSLTNCWDGNPLPGGAYQLVATQDLYSVSLSEPSDTGEVTVTIGGAADPDAPVEDLNNLTQRVVDLDAGYTFISDPVEFAIDGDVPADPFGQYLNIVVPEVPEGYLSPAIARELFRANLATNGWDMAKGTQRVLLTNDSAASNTLWENSYFGCPWDGSVGKSFPSVSAEFPLLEVTASLPSRVSLSYGWIVDDNPRVDLGVKNVSGYTLPQLYEPNGSLLFVRDGKVVGEAYLTNLNRDGIYADSSYLNPESALKGEYVWRDVSGCWTQNGSVPLAAGTYTVLNSQYLYLSTDTYGTKPFLDGALSSYSGGEMRGGGSVGITAPQAEVAPDIAVDPGYDMRIMPVGEWVELQVWTSLGTVTITT